MIFIEHQRVFLLCFILLLLQSYIVIGFQRLNRVSEFFPSTIKQNRYTPIIFLNSYHHRSSAINEIHQNEKNFYIKPLYAKKKASKLISDDLLFAIDSDSDENDKVIEKDESLTENPKNKKKDKGKKKAIESNEKIDFVDNTLETPTTTNSPLEEDLSTESEMTVEQRFKREKPPARIRFAESSQPDFVMLALEKVGLVFGNEVVLKNASFSVITGERVGLVGQNGCGKTTQLRILSGELEPTTGDVVKSSRNLRLAFLRQEFIDQLDEKLTLREELKSSFLEENSVLKKISECEAELSNVVDDTEKMEEILNRLAELQEEARSRDLYSLDSKIDKVMDSMGFSIADQESKIDTFSGGWKMRIGLAKILLQEPNVLLLDEPTNHMDIDSVYWLEDFLQKQNIPMVIVSHDREFLDRVCNKIVEIEDGVTYSYLGNYSKYLDQRRIRLESWREKFDKQSKYIKEEETYIKKAKNDPSMSSQVKSREASLEKFKLSDDFVPQPPKEKKFRFRFPPAPRCSANIIELSKIAHGYHENDLLFKDVFMEVRVGDRVGFLGPNGSGKSTLMRIMYGIEKPIQGYSDFGSNNVIVNYFEQNQADALDMENTVVDTIMEVAPSDYTLTDTRNLLGQFMFKGDDANKKIKMLSGGEKARVALCKMMLQPANLLLLDEPTNHLDITSKEVLEEAIRHYDGAVVVISHDRYFLSQVVNKIYAFNDCSVQRFDMDYHDYMEFQGSDFKDKVTSRYVEGDRYRISNAKPLVIEEKNTKKNFGGSGVTSGNLNKGIKNAKRYS